VRGRLFLLNLPRTGGPYLGAGSLLRERKTAYFTVGLFGGSGLFFEVQFRPSSRRPIAAIPSWGLRMTFL
jgi:hypothetical protein